MSNVSNKHHVRHVRQSLDDFNKDIHRFTYIYNGEKQNASIIGNVTVLFADESNIPDTVKSDVQEEIYKRMDKKETQWIPPKGAKEIADAYCAYEFHN